MKKTLELKQPLAGRTKFMYELEVGKKATPKLTEVSKQISEDTKSKEELIVIKKINHEFGKTKVFIEAYVYNNLDIKTKFERINNKRTLEAEKKALEEAEAAKKAEEEAKATESQESKEETPKEENKEEKKEA